MQDKDLDVVVVGSLIMDLICYANRIPKLGETLEGTNFNTGFGGKGGNQCVAAARLGAKCAFIGKVGDDAYGKQYYDNIKSEGTNVDCIHVEKDESTGVASIIVGENDGQNIIVIIPGANKLVSLDYIKNVGEAYIRRAKVVVVQLEIPIESSLLALKMAKQYGARSIFNVAPAVTGLPKEMFQLSDILCLNESEAELITGIPSISTKADAESAITILVQKFHCNNVIITVGPEGAVLWDKIEQNYLYATAPKIKAVDTTGAGDCFVGTFAFCLSRGDDLYTSLKKAVANASDSVLRKGTQCSFPHNLI